MMLEMVLVEVKLFVGSWVIVMKCGDVGFVGQEVCIVIEMLKQMVEFFNKNFLGIVEVIVVYELFNYQSVKSLGCIFYDELKFQFIIFFMWEDMFGMDQGFMMVFVYE